MKFHMPHKVGRSLATTAGLGALFLTAAAGPAAADTSQATANAATLSLLGGTLLNTGTCTVSNTGAPQAQQNCSQTPAVTTFQSVITAGVLAQSAVARPNGTSAACAGLVGATGTIQIGAAGDCTVLTPGPSGGVTLDLGTVATLRADAILAQCVASSTGGAPMATVTLVNAAITLVGGTAIPLNSMPTPNTSVANLGPLLTVTLNEQPVPQAANQVMATALHVTVLGLVPGTAPLVDLTVGTVSCGPNAVSAATPIFAGQSLPISLAAATGVGAVVLIRRRRQTV